MSSSGSYDSLKPIIGYLTSEDDEAAGVTHLCNDCEKINFSKLFEEETWDDAAKSRHWVLLQNFSERSDWDTGTRFRAKDCWLCSYLFKKFAWYADYDELVAMDRWMPCHDKLRDHAASIRDWAPTLWDAVEDGGPPHAFYIQPLPKDPKRSISYSASLLYQNHRSPPGIFEPKQPPPYVNLDIAKSWISACQSYHPGCSKALPTPPIRLIDCATKEYKVVKADMAMEYIALSYVWGASTQAMSYKWQAKLTVETLPRTIQDAILVTESLGYRYLWIDRYCIKQDDPADKLEQIALMELIYRRAAITIIAAAGDNDDHGIPGIRTPRRIFEKPRKHRDLNFWKKVDPVFEVFFSYWFRRGWTYQEGFLSRRRLVFTENMVYFQCLATEAYDSLGSCEHVLDKREMEEYDLLMSKTHNTRTLGKLPQGNAAAHLTSFHQNLREYTRRLLSYSSDAFQAFSGVADLFRSSKHPILTLYGIPLLVKEDSMSADMSFSLGLHWSRGYGARPLVCDPSYASMGPSWSWVKAMSKDVSWVHVDAAVAFHPTNIRLQSEDSSGTLLTLAEYAAVVSVGHRRGLSESEPRILHLDAYLLSKEAFLGITMPLQERQTVIFRDDVASDYDRDSSSDNKLTLGDIQHIAEEVDAGISGLLLLGAQDSMIKNTELAVSILLLQWSADGTASRVGLIRMYSMGKKSVVGGLLAELGITRTCVRLC